MLEAHTITTLSKACQHLILIGDHQQVISMADASNCCANKLGHFHQTRLANTKTYCFSVSMDTMGLVSFDYGAELLGDFSF